MGRFSEIPRAHPVPGKLDQYNLSSQCMGLRQQSQNSHGHSPVLPLCAASHSWNIPRHFKQPAQTPWITKCDFKDTSKMTGSQAEICPLRIFTSTESRGILKDLSWSLNRNEHSCYTKILSSVALRSSFIWLLRHLVLCQKTQKDPMLR